MVVFTAKPLELRDNDVLVLSFQSQNDVDALKQHSAPGEGIGDYLKKAVFDVLGFTPKLLARLEGSRPPAAAAPPAAPPASATPVPASSASVAATTVAPPTVSTTALDNAESANAAPTNAAPTDLTPPEPTEPDIEPPVPTAVVSWETAVVTDSEPETKPAPAPARVAPPVIKAPEPVAEPKPTVKAAPAPVVSGNQRYGEAVVREILGASFIEEQIVAPRVQPREE
jgi:DNA polymerase-3 subunit gamma/tau